ncbi:MAG: Ribosomal RNA small subunit methyltransferase G [Paracidovorax wautersii]|uniref:Ribosomal RNA small subunit methyltransferase G n=1 Tax=Paracidovorax wautersii TaxID=1177982 RepID=A0A7V8FL70_9BURK|nr:MAG: Ribosomal RNA small subunit methyltransferase G [Paracidovorax wautersii]
MTTTVSHHNHISPATPLPLEPALREGLQQLGLTLSDAQIGALLQYLALVGKWTQVYNLTAVRDPQEMLSHHLLDCLAIIQPLQAHLAQAGLAEGADLLDVGAGAGLPGVVIAICCPQVRVSCVDTVAKKAAFVQQVAATLRLPNLRGVHARVEKLQQRFDVITSRAFASLPDFTVWSRDSLAEQGVWLAMKGKVPDAEIAALPAEVAVFHVEQLRVPRLEGERCLVWMKLGAAALG